MHRREFLTNTAISGTGFAISPTGSLLAENKKVKIGIIGTGMRGQNHLELLLKRADTEVVAICDVDEGMLIMAKKLFADEKNHCPKYSLAATLPTEI